MSKVTEQLYIGSVLQASDKKWLKDHHITHIVNAAQELNNFYPKEFVYLNLNFDDIRQQSLFPDIDLAYKFITDSIGKGGTVLVHCHAGISRSSSVVIYFIMRVKGWNFDQALSYLRQKHPRAHPNSGFVSQLQDYGTNQSEKKLFTQNRNIPPVINDPFPRRQNHYSGNNEYVYSIGTYTPGVHGNTRYANLNTVNVQMNDGFYYW